MDGRYMRVTERRFEQLREASRRALDTHAVGAMRQAVTRTQRGAALQRLAEERREERLRRAAEAGAARQALAQEGAALMALLRLKQASDADQPPAVAELQRVLHQGEALLPPVRAPSQNSSAAPSQSRRTYGATFLPSLKAHVVQ